VVDRYHVEGLARGLKILSVFSENRRELTLTEIAALTSLPVSTCFRILHTLQESDYVERLPNGSFAPGLAVLSLGFAAMRSSELAQASAAPLRKLATEIGETVNLGVLSGSQVLYIQRVPSAEMLIANIQIGSLLPAAATSIGKLLLAFRPPADLRVRLTAGDFGRAQGPNAIRSLDALLPQLKIIREANWSVQDEEMAFGLRSIAVPVRDSEGDVAAAINVAVSVSRWTIEDLIAGCLERMRKTAEEISKRWASTGDGRVSPLPHGRNSGVAVKPKAGLRPKRTARASLPSL